MQKKKRRRRKRQLAAARILICVILLIAILLTGKGIFSIIRKTGGKQQKQTIQQATASNQQKSEKKAAAEEKASTQQPLDSAASEMPKDTPAASDTADDTSGTNQPFTAADLDQPDGFDQRPTENGIVLENQQIDLNGLDTTCLDWGQGGDTDEWNRPAGCLLYQNKYGQYNAYFISDKPEKKVIYLTLDEGYEYGCSARILDVLKEKNVHAVFFITKPYAEQNPDLVRRMIEEGHELGNHSKTHPSAGLPSQTIDQQTAEVTDTHQYVKEQFGYDMHLFRYPAGKFSEQSIALLNNLNYKSVFWSFAYLDYDVNNQPDPAESLQKVVSRLHPGAIYLLHAESETNTQILGEFIDQARAQGYEFKVFE